MTMTPGDLTIAAAQIRDLANTVPGAVVRYSPVGRLCVYPPNDPAPLAVLNDNGVLDVFDFDETVDP